MRNYTKKERLLILMETIKFIKENNENVEMLNKMKNGGMKDKNIHVVISRLREYSEFDCRSNGALTCQIASIVVAKYYNDGRNYSEQSTSQKYVKLLEELEEEY